MPFVVNTVRIELAEPPLGTVTFAGFSLIDSPDGFAMLNKETVPAKPFRLVTVMVDVPEEPRRITRLDGLAERAKAGLVLLWTRTPTCTAWVLVGLAPVTVTE